MLNPLEPWIKQFIKDRGLKVMRRKDNRIALNVSYSEDGLRWTANNRRKLFYYKNAELRHKKVGDMWLPYAHPLSPDGLQKSDSIIIEDFVPEDHYYPNGEKLIPKLQVAEYLWSNKGLKLLYHVDEIRPEESDRLVWSTQNSSIPAEA
jgi:hypothetical protein